MNNKAFFKDKKAICIVFGVVFACVLMALVDGVWQPGYLIKSVCKVILFIGVMLIFALIHKNEIKSIKEIFRPSKKGVLVSLLLGAGVFAIILGAYFILRGFYDFSSIAGLIEGIGVNGDNFVYVSIYISFMNSFLEEVFFRGFAFLILKEHSSRTLAYIFSSLTFAAYHVAIMNGWFNLPLFLLAMLGLFVGGIIFDFLNEKFHCIYLSWTVHMFANFGINTIGFIILGII